MTQRLITFSFLLLFIGFSANANHSDNTCADAPPEAAFAIGNPSGCIPHAADFIDYSSDNTTSWAWTFEGGSPATSTDQDPVIDYNTPGEYLVTLIASNAEGSDTATAQVQIYNMAPVAKYHYEISGTTTTFTNQMTNTDTHIWEFGDGNTSTEINPVHTYAAEGTYVARLKASNNCTTDIYLEVVVIGGNYQAIGHNANEYIAPYDAPFRPGANLGYNPPYNDIDLANIAAGNPEVGVQGVGVKTIRPSLPEHFMAQYGYDVRLDEFEHYGNLGLEGNTLIVGFPSDENKDTTHHCPDIQSELFANMYSDIWDNGENGTPVNDDNPLALYLYKLVHLYKDNVTFYEIWNEPGFDYTFLTGWLPPGEPGNWWENNPDPCDYKLRAPIFHYIRILRISYEVINYIDPDAFITLGAVGYPSFMDAVLRNTDNPNEGAVTSNYPLGGGAYFDAVSIHSYPHFDGTLSEWNDDIQDFDYFRHSDKAASGIERTKTIYQDVLFDYGYDGNTFPEKKWMITEINIPRKQFGNYIGSEEAQVNFIIKAYIEAIQQDMLEMHIFDLAEPFYYDDAVNEFQLMGLYQRLYDIYPYNQIANNEGIAYKTTSDLLFESTYDLDQTAAMNLPDEVEGAAFLDGNGHYTYVMWSKTYVDQSEATSFNYDFPAALNISNLEKREWDFCNTANLQNINGTNVILDGRPIFLTDVNNTVLIPPTVGFDIAGTLGCAAFTIDFLDESSTNTTSWLWTFEGGTPATSSEQNPTVTYNQAGEFDVTLVASNAVGTETLVKNDLVVVSENLPTSAFTAVVDGLVVTFFNNSQNELSYQWNMDDGFMFEEANPTHTYSTHGYYDIVLITHNGCGSDTLIQTIIVDPSNVVPNPEFTSSISSGCAPLTVEFFDQSTPNTTAWFWQFQDGNPSTSSEQNPVVTFNTPGSFFAKLVASNDAGSDTEYKGDYVLVTNDAPSVDFTFGTSDLNAFFFNSANNATSYLWDFGDNNTSTEENPTHIYATSGDYEVTLTAINECGETSITYTLSVSSFPTASFSADLQEGCAPLTVQFNDESSSNSSAWIWAFPGGNPANSTDQYPLVTYNSPGNYDVTLIASNSLGADTFGLTEYIAILDEPTANFDFTELDGFVSFNNSSSNSDNYFWDLGNGNTSSETNPTNQYDMTGTYDITLIAANACGADTIAQTINIELTNTRDLATFESFMIFPNPGNGLFVISLSGIPDTEALLSVYNMLGQQMLVKSFPFGMGKLREQIDLSDLPEGGYILEVRTANSLVLGKVLIQR